MPTEYIYTIEMMVQDFPAKLRQKYDDETKCDAAMNQLKTASGTVTFGGWEVKGEHILAFRKKLIEKNQE